MKTPKKTRRSKKEVDHMLAVACRDILAMRAGEPQFNGCELARRSGIHRNEVHRRLKRRFVTSHEKTVAGELRRIARRNSAPAFMATQMLACVRRNSVWFSIETAGKSCLLKEMIRENLRAELTEKWNAVNSQKSKACYEIFIERFFEIVHDWERDGYDESAVGQHEQRLTALLAACANGNMDRVIYS